MNILENVISGLVVGIIVLLIEYTIFQGRSIRSILGDRVGAKDVNSKSDETQVNDNSSTVKRKTNIVHSQAPLWIGLAILNIGILYWITPLDLIPGLPIDDVIVMSLCLWVLIKLGATSSPDSGKLALLWHKSIWHKIGLVSSNFVFVYLFILVTYMIVSQL